MELRVGDEEEAYLYRIYCKVKTGPNRENKSCNQIKRCMCVEFLDETHTPFYMTLFFYFGIWAIFLFLFFHASRHGYFSSTFLFHSPYSFCNMKSYVKVMEYFCVDERHVSA